MYLSSLKKRYLTTNPESYPGKEEEISHELLYSSQYLFKGTLKTKTHKKPQPFALQILATNSTTWSSNSFLPYTVYLLKREKKNHSLFFFFLKDMVCHSFLYYLLLYIRYFCCWGNTYDLLNPPGYQRSLQTRKPNKLGSDTSRYRTPAPSNILTVLFSNITSMHLPLCTKYTCETLPSIKNKAFLVS